MYTHTHKNYILVEIPAFSSKALQPLEIETKTAMLGAATAPSSNE